MPSAGQGNQWLCSRCGLGNFRDYNEANQHEMQCDPYNRKRRRPSSPVGKSNNVPFSFKAEDQHYFPIEIEQPTPNQPFPTKTPSNEPRFKPRIFSSCTQLPLEKLSPLDGITCQNVEVFKASAGDVADHEGSSGMIVNKGQIGFRCIHCAKTPFAKAEYSSVFPGSLGSVAASLELMTKIHFQKCTALDQETRNRLQAAKSSFRAEHDDEEWYSEAFVEFSLDASKKMNIINRSPPQTGIVLGQSKPNTPTPSGAGYLNDGGINANMQLTPTDNMPVQNLTQQHGIQSQYQQQQPSNISTEQYPALGQIRNDEKPQVSSTREQQQSIGPASSKGGSPPSLYDSPGSMNFPYMQNQQGFWECRYCWGTPWNQRANGSFWQSTMPPNRQFMEHHLNQCQGRGGHSNFSTPTQNQIFLQGNQYDNMNQQWNTPKNNQSFAYSNLQMQLSPQAGNRPPRPPSVPPQFNTEGMNPQEAYAYQQMQMYNQMQMYGQNSDFNQNYGFSQQCMFPNNPNVDSMMYQKNPMAVRSDGNLKNLLEHLETEEAKAEERFDRINEEEKRDLVFDEDKSLLTDYFFHVMKQLRFCRFSESDRKTRGGKRDNIKVGFGGLKCVHCSDTQNSRKFFWSNVDRLANSFAEIPGHVLKCRRCPQGTKNALIDLKAMHSDQMSKLPRGSQKIFFRRMWRRLHDTKERLSIDSLEGGESPRPSPLGAKNDENTAVESGEEIESSSSRGNIIVGMNTEEAAKALAECAAGKKSISKIVLALDEDKSWLSDMDCFVRSNLEVFCATQNDVKFAESDSKYPITVGQIGIRCIHCAMSLGGARGPAVHFPADVKSIYNHVREFHKMHLESCPCLPQEYKDKLATFKGSASLSSILRRYYIQAAEALGIHDTDDGMFGGGEAKPIVARKEDKDSDLSDSIRHRESSNQEFLDMTGVEHLTKKRKLGE